MGERVSSTVFFDEEATCSSNQLSGESVTVSFGSRVTFFFENEQDAENTLWEALSALRNRDKEGV
jgi:hypothetical protein